MRDLFVTAVIVSGIVAIGVLGGQAWGWAFPRDTDWIGILLIGALAGGWARSSLRVYVWLLDRSARRDV